MEKKPFYKRWWFIAIVAIIVIGALTGGDDESESADNNEVETEEVNESVEDTEDTEEEPEEVDETTREDEIRDIIKSRVEEHNNYSGFEIDEIRVNENLGDEENDTFIVLVDAVWTRKNTEDTSNDFIETLSQDISANLHNEGADDVAEIVVFTHDEYNDNDHKHSFEWAEQGFKITEQVIN